MKFTCEKNILLDTMNIVTKAVPSKAVNPLIEGVKIDAYADILISGTDLEMSVKSIVKDAKIIKTGTVLINARIFYDILRKMPDGEIVFEVNDKGLIMICGGNSSFKLQSMPYDEYPTISEVKKEKSFILSSLILKNMIKNTIFATAQNENRLILTGCLFEVSKDKVKIIAIDGYRMAMRSIPLSVNEEFSFVVPQKALNELLKILKDDDTMINISVSNKNISFEFENSIVITRRLEGEFLNYEQIIPKESTTRARVFVKEIIESLERASLIVNYDNIKTPVKMNIRKKEIELACVNQLGDAHDVILANIEGEDLEIGFNHKFLLDALHALECDEVILEMTTNLNPLVIKPLDGQEFIYMILPVRLKG